MNVHLPPSATHAPEWPTYTPAELARVHEAAIERAHALRRQAISEFWRDADVWVYAAVDRGRRAATRLAARLHQHAKQRHGSAAAGEL